MAEHASGGARETSRSVGWVAREGIRAILWDFRRWNEQLQRSILERQERRGYTREGWAEARRHPEREGYGRREEGRSYGR